MTPPVLRLTITHRKKGHPPRMSASFRVKAPYEADVSRPLRCRERRRAQRLCQRCISVPAICSGSPELPMRRCLRGSFVRAAVTATGRTDAAIAAHHPSATAAANTARPATAGLGYDRFRGGHLPFAAAALRVGLARSMACLVWEANSRTAHRDVGHGEREHHDEIYRNEEQFPNTSHG
jgi:hypothetical protein